MGVVAGVLVLALLVVFLVIFIRRRKRNRQDTTERGTNGIEMAPQHYDAITARQTVTDGSVPYSALPEGSSSALRIPSPHMQTTDKEEIDMTELEIDKQIGSGRYDNVMWHVLTCDVSSPVMYLTACVSLLSSVACS